MKYQAKDIMTKAVHTVRPETSIQDLKRLFQKESISSAPVIDELSNYMTKNCITINEEEEIRVAGILSSFDILNYVVKR